MDERSPDIPTRRLVLLGAAGLGLALPAAASPAAMDQAIRGLVGDATVKRGKVKLELPPIVENGNVVPLTVTVDSPMSKADHVTAIHIFNEKNPQPYVAAFELGPRAGRAAVSTRIRLADFATGRGDRPGQRRQLLVRQRRCHRNLGGLRRRVRGRWRGS